MPGPRHGWLYVLGPDGTPYELFNHARTAAYLRDVGLPNGMTVCDILDDGGCTAYAMRPPCGTDDGYVYLPGTANNQLNVVDAANLDIVGDLALVVDFAADDWTNGTQSVISKRQTTTNHSYGLRLTSDGRFEFVWSSNGSTVNTAQSIMHGYPNGLRVMIAASIDVNNGAAGRTIRFWRTINEGDSWTQIGTDVVQATATSIFSGSAGIQVSSFIGGSEPFAGKFYRGKIHNAIGVGGVPAGTVVLDIDGNNIRDTSEAAAAFTAATGQNVGVSQTNPTTGTQLIVGSGQWERLSFSTPAADNAPWYSSDFPESGEALGFWIEEWTGLDNSHVSRPVTPKGGYGGGSQAGVLSAAGRNMAFNVLLFARSEEAMEYQFRWLEQTLSSVCATCATESILIRRFCPENIGTDDQNWNGVARLNGVGLIAGPQWEQEPTNLNQCFFRRISFVLNADDPCMYLMGSEESFGPSPDVVSCLNAIDTAPVRTPCRPTCFELNDTPGCRQVATFDVTAREAALAPVVSLFNDSTEFSIPVRLTCYYDPLEIGVDNPCGLQILGQAYVAALRPSATFIWDVAAREPQYHDNTTGGLVPGYPYLGPSDPPLRRWFVLPCGQIHITVEPSTACLQDLGAGVYTDGTHVFNDPHFPTPSVEIVPRVGCP